jgi:hypothetical protein
MSQALAFYEGHSFYEWVTWRSVRELIGHGLRERYQIPKELPPRLLALVRKLDAIEGNYLLRYAPPLERRSVGESDWLPLRFVWENDVDLFGSIEILAQVSRQTID